jgi:hypothetical protein
LNSSRSEKIFLSSAILILLFFIIIFSLQDTIITISKEEKSGSNNGTVLLKGNAYFMVKWEFYSTSPVDLLIIKEITFEYFKKLEAVYGIYGYKMNLTEFYVSKGLQADSGETKLESSETLLIKFETNGYITYNIYFDPITFDFLYILYTILGIFLLIGLILFIPKFKKNGINHNASNLSNNPIKIDINLKVRYCELCGTKVDLDAIFCHQCGQKLFIFNHLEK